jgi:hypothetical protein
VQDCPTCDRLCDAWWGGRTKRGVHMSLTVVMRQWHLTTVRVHSRDGSVFGPVNQSTDVKMLTEGQRVMVVSEQMADDDLLCGSIVRYK